MNLTKNSVSEAKRFSMEFVKKNEQAPLIKDRIIQLDGLRGVAVLMVVAFHFLDNQYAGLDLNPVEKFLQKTTSFGWTGVDLFFILSGFLIGSILLKNRGSKFFFRTFYIRRLLRIIPIYYVLLAIFFGIHYTPLFISSAYIFDYPIPLWNFITFTQNFVMAAQNHFGPAALTPTWSLAVEEQFYLIIPLIVYFFRNKYLPYVIGIFIALAIVTRSLATNWYQEYTLLPCRIDTPIIGFMVAYLLQYDSIVSFIRKHLSKIKFSFLFIFVPLTGSAIFFDSGHLNHTIIAIFFAAVLLIVRFTVKGMLYNILTYKPLLLIGRYSYFIYLYHQLINGLLHLHILGHKKQMLFDANSYLVTGASLVIVYVLSAFSFRYFEKPLIDYSHRYKY
jgi:peptidoglycan/LPS O-acetylase OafA/YrhL